MKKIRFIGVSRLALSVTCTALLSGCGAASSAVSALVTGSDSSSSSGTSASLSGQAVMGPCYGSTAQLYLGSSLIASTITDSSGNYTLLVSAENAVTIAASSQPPVVEVSGGMCKSETGADFALDTPIKAIVNDSIAAGALLSVPVSPFTDMAAQSFETMKTASPSANLRQLAATATTYIENKLGFSIKSNCNPFDLSFQASSSASMSDEMKQACMHQIAIAAAATAAGQNPVVFLKSMIGSGGEIDSTKLDVIATKISEIASGSVTLHAGAEPPVSGAALTSFTPPTRGSESLDDVKTAVTAVMNAQSNSSGSSSSSSEMKLGCFMWKRGALADGHIAIAIKSGSDGKCVSSLSLGSSVQPVQPISFNMSSPSVAIDLLHFGDHSIRGKCSLTGSNATLLGSDVLFFVSSKKYTANVASSLSSLSSTDAQTAAQGACASLGGSYSAWNGSGYTASTSGSSSSGSDSGSSGTFNPSAFACGLNADGFPVLFNPVVGGPIQSDCSAPSLPPEEQAGLRTSAALLASIPNGATIQVSQRAGVLCSGASGGVAHMFGTSLIVYDKEGSYTGGQLCTGSFGGLPTAFHPATGGQASSYADQRLNPAHFLCAKVDDSQAAVFYSGQGGCGALTGGDGLSAGIVSGFNPSQYSGVKVCSLPSISSDNIGVLGANAIVYSKSGQSDAEARCTVLQATATQANSDALAAANSN